MSQRQVASYIRELIRDHKSRRENPEWHDVYSVQATTEECLVIVLRKPGTTEPGRRFHIGVSEFPDDPRVHGDVDLDLAVGSSLEDEDPWMDDRERESERCGCPYCVCMERTTFGVCGSCTAGAHQG